MDMLHIMQLEGVSWQPHPTIEGVLTRVFENRASHPLCDVLMGQIAPGGKIPWHIHDAASETAYVIQGHGTIFYTLDNTQFEASERGELAPGVAITVAQQVWHSVLNTGNEPMILFAFHTPPTF